MITDEAVEAAANAISEASGLRFDGFWSRVEDMEPEDREYALKEARAALEAATKQAIPTRAVHAAAKAAYEDVRPRMGFPTGFDKAPEPIKDTYRSMALAALEAAELLMLSPRVLTAVCALMEDPEHYDSQGPSSGYVSVDKLRDALGPR